MKREKKDIYEKQKCCWKDVNNVNKMLRMQYGLKKKLHYSKRKYNFAKFVSTRNSKNIFGKRKDDFREEKKWSVTDILRKTTGKEVVKKERERDREKAYRGAPVINELWLEKGPP